VSLGFGWSGDERSSAAEGNRLYEAERYGDAVTAYGEGLADHPESERLRFNLGAAQYKSGAYEDALATLKRLTPEPGPDDGTLAVRRPAALEGKALYNAGNTRFRLAQQAEEKDLAGAVALCKEALGAYKRAMAADPEDVDAKFNHEFAARHLAELEKRLEDQRRQQERSGQEDASGQPQGEEQRQNQQEGGREERDQSAQEQQAHDEGETPEQPAGQRPKQEEPATQQAEAGGGDENRPEEQARSPEGAGAETQPTGQQASGDAGQDRAAAQARGAGRTAADAASPEGTMTAADARALVDAARGEEIDPREVPRRFAVPATVGEAAREW
jgi:Ca-activated chloride channel family protein